MATPDSIITTPGRNGNGTNGTLEKWLLRTVLAGALVGAAVWGVTGVKDSGAEALRLSRDNQQAQAVLRAEFNASHMEAEREREDMNRRLSELKDAMDEANKNINRILRHQGTREDK